MPTTCAEEGRARRGVAPLLFRDGAPNGIQEVVYGRFFEKMGAAGLMALTCVGLSLMVSTQPASNLHSVATTAGYSGMSVGGSVGGAAVVAHAPTYNFVMTYVALTFDDNGLGEEARHMLLALNRAGVPLAIVTATISEPAVLQPQVQSRLQSLSAHPDHARASAGEDLIGIFHVFPDLIQSGSCPTAHTNFHARAQTPPHPLTAHNPSPPRIGVVPLVPDHRPPAVDDRGPTSTASTLGQHIAFASRCLSSLHFPLGSVQYVLGRSASRNGPNRLGLSTE